MNLKKYPYIHTIISDFDPVYQKLFLKFCMKEEGLMERFEFNIRRERRKGYKLPYNDDTMFESIFNHPITWMQTPEGRFYWMELNREWKKYIKEKIQRYKKYILNKNGR